MQQNQPAVATSAPTILLTGGGSGGHITPLLSLARELKNLSPNSLIVYVGLKGEKLDRLSDEYAVFDEVFYVSSGKFRRYHGESLLAHLLDPKTLLLNARDFFKVIIGIFSSRSILKRVRPDVVFSKGGFVAVPVGIAARSLNLPIVTHDSDTVPGLANRIIGRWAKIHATGMPAEYYSYPKETTRYVGIPLGVNIVPVDAERQAEYKQAIGIPVSRKVILVSGGGLGAQSLNDQVVSMCQELFKSNPDTTIIHFTGSSNETDIRGKYSAVLNEGGLSSVQVIGFSPDFYKYSGAADLVITRAGATTLAELAIQGKACIVVPSPFLTGGHQLKNARHLKEAGAVEVVPNNATPHELFKKVKALLESDKDRAELAGKLSLTAKTGAAAELASIVLGVAVKKA